jgi:hypothetical protein
MSDTTSKKAPKVLTISAEYTFQSFDSLLLIDAGSDGFRLKDSANSVVVIPTGVPVSIAAQAGMASGPITVQAPASGTLNVSAIYYS